MAAPKITIAQNKLGQPVYVGEVESGLQTDCTCYCCGEYLVAKKGRWNAWHFSHHSGSDCVGAYETMLHKVSKHVLLGMKYILVSGGEDIYGTELYVNSQFRVNTAYGFRVYGVFDDTSNFIKKSAPGLFEEYESIRSKFCKKLMLPIRDVIAEKYDQSTGRIPDIQVTIDTDQLKARYPFLPDGAFESVFLEVAVTHRCDEAKIAQLSAAGKATIEIDMKPLTKEENLTVDRIQEFILAHFREIPEWLVIPTYMKKEISRYKEIKDSFSKILQDEADSFFSINLSELESLIRQSRKNKLFIEIDDAKSGVKFSIFKCREHAVMQLGFIGDQVKFKTISRYLSDTSFMILKLDKRWFYVLPFGSVNKAFEIMKDTFGNGIIMGSHRSF